MTKYLILAVLVAFCSFISATASSVLGLVPALFTDANCEGTPMVQEFTALRLFDFCYYLPINDPSSGRNFRSRIRSYNEDTDTVTVRAYLSTDCTGASVAADPVDESTLECAFFSTGLYAKQIPQLFDFGDLVGFASWFTHAFTEDISGVCFPEIADADLVASPQPAGQAFHVVDGTCLGNTGGSSSFSISAGPIMEFATVNCTGPGTPRAAGCQDLPEQNATFFLGDMGEPSSAAWLSYGVPVLFAVLLSVGSIV